MATTINGTTGKNSSYWKYYLVCTEQDVSTTNNTSKLKVDVYLGATSYSRAVRGAITATHTVNVNGTNYTFTTGAYTIEKNTNYLLGSITTNAITHNDDGSKSVSVSASSPDLAQASGYGPYSGSASGTVTLTKIDRYANLTSLSVKSKTINSITLQYTTDRNAWLFAKLNDGDWLNDGEPFKSNTTSGTFTIYYKDRASTKRLDPNTKYKITVLCRALDRDSGLDTQKDVETTTYDIAKLVSVPDVNIGSKQTITWTNPSGATTSLKLAKTDNTQIANVGTVTGTSKEYTPTASTIYALTPNSNTYKARYIITTTANSTNYTNYKDFTFKVTNSNPTFTTYTYADVNSTTTALTGNNQILVKGYSNNKVTITTTNKAVAKNSATMKTYKLVQASSTGSATANYSSSASVTLQVNKITNNVMTVSATDSRGNSTSVAKTLSSTYYKSYADVVIKTVTAVRGNNGVGQAVTLAYSGTFWNSSFGSVTNAITVSYQYKKITASSWSTGKTTLTPTISGNNYSGSVNIQGDLGADGFDVAESYNIRLTVKDKLVTKTYDVTLGAGTPAVAIYKSNVAIGQKYDTSEGSKLQVNGGINIKVGTSDNPESGYRIGGKTILRNNGTTTIISANAGTGLVFRPNGDMSDAAQAILGKDGNFDAKSITVDGRNVMYGLQSSRQRFTVAGDANTYYPVRFTLKDNKSGFPYSKFTISRAYAWTAPDSWYSSTHKGGLTFSWYWTGDTSWGGNDHTIKVLRFHENYCKMVGGIKPCTTGLIVWLRGGTALYELESEFGYLVNITIHTSSYTDGAGTVFSPISYNASQVLTTIKQAMLVPEVVTLYNNTTGTNGTVTLSETSANFSYLDIYYYKSESDMGGKIYNVVRVYSPNGKLATLENSHVATAIIMQVLTKLVSISGTSITVKKEMLTNFTVNTTSVSECTTPATSQTYIVRVVGHRN